MVYQWQAVNCRELYTVHIGHVDMVLLPHGADNCMHSDMMGFGRIAERMIGQLVVD